MSRAIFGVDAFKFTEKWTKQTVPTISFKNYERKPLPHSEILDKMSSFYQSILRNEKRPLSFRDMQPIWRFRKHFEFPENENAVGYLMLSTWLKCHNAFDESKMFQYLTTGHLSFIERYKYPEWIMKMYKVSLPIPPNWVLEQYVILSASAPSRFQSDKVMHCLKHLLSQSYPVRALTFYQSLRQMTESLFLLNQLNETKDFKWLAMNLIHSLPTNTEPMVFIGVANVILQVNICSLLLAIKQKGASGIDLSPLQQILKEHHSLMLLLNYPDHAALTWQSSYRLALVCADLGSKHSKVKDILKWMSQSKPYRVQEPLVLVASC